MPTLQRSLKIFRDPNFLALSVLAIVVVAVTFGNRQLIFPESTAAQTLRQTFADVSPENTFWQLIDNVSTAGVMNGFPCGGATEPCDDKQRPYFRWGQPFTRGDLLTSLEALRGTQITSSQQVYADVPPETPGYIGATLVASKNLLQSYPCGGEAEPCDSVQRPYLRLQTALTRGEISRTVFAIDSEDLIFVLGTRQQTFEDVTIDQPDWQAIEYAQYLNLLSGWSCGTPERPCVKPGNKPYFGPDVVLTRAQAAKVIYLGLVKKAE